MIKNLLHKVFSISLTLIVLFSTVSFTVEKHFCDDALVDIAIFTEVENCCDVVTENSYTEKSCCKDEITVIEGQNELIFKTFDDYEVVDQLFIASFIYSFNNFYEELPQKVIPHKDYSPPNLNIDTQSMLQVFII